MLLVRKADGTWWLCVDYQDLNSVTIKDKFLILVVKELMDELQGTMVFSKLDLGQGTTKFGLNWIMCIRQLLRLTNDTISS